MDVRGWVGFFVAEILLMMMQLQRILVQDEEMRNGV